MQSLFFPHFPTQNVDGVARGESTSLQERERQRLDEIFPGLLAFHQPTVLGHTPYVPPDNCYLGWRNDLTGPQIKSISEVIIITILFAISLKLLPMGWGNRCQMQKGVL